MSVIFWSFRLPSKEGMMPERPVSIVERTMASVAGAPLGSCDRRKIPARFGGILARSERLPLWQPQQSSSKSAFPRAIACSFSLRVS